MNRNVRLPHPATMFFILMLVVLFLSWILDAYGMQVVHPETGEEIAVRSLLSPEGMRWMLRHVVTNFTGFSSLGWVVVALFGMGLAQHAGFVDACLRRWCGQGGGNRRSVVWVVVLFGLSANVLGDVGYIVWLPLAASLFAGVGLSPVAGLVTALVSVGCGYSANLMLTTLDAMLASMTQEALGRSDAQFGQVGAMSNLYFLAISFAMLAVMIVALTRYFLVPRLGASCEVSSVPLPTHFSRKERRAFRMAWGIVLLYVLAIVWATYSLGGILRGAGGGLARSPLMDGMMLLVAVGFGLAGLVYGFVSGRYRRDVDVVEGLTSLMPLLKDYFIIVFFAAQMVAFSDYAHLDRCLAIKGAELLVSVPFDGVGLLVLFILFTAVVNLFMVSATAKWAIMAFIFVPVLGEMQLAPDVVQCAYRIGDSTTNVLSPFMYYLPLVLTYLRRYEPRATYGTLFRYTWPYTLCILLGWSCLFVVWYLCDLPFGL